MSKTRHTPHPPTGRRLLDAGASIDAHRHDGHQLVYAGRGVVEVITEAGAWVAPASRALWIPAGTVHAHRAHGPTELRLVGLAPTERTALDEPGAGWERPAVVAVTGLLRELILAYSGEADLPGGERERLRGVLVDRLRRAPGQPVHVPAARDPRLAAVCRLVRDDPADPRGLRELGRAVGAGERTLARLFRSEFGMGFRQWRTQVRLHRAVVLLAEGVPVTSVAVRCGWSSPSAFIEVFRKAFGHTPGRAFTV
ncbi:AraC family transcriptional regulator [Nonomuraea sp. NPDC050328]|uniref:AraC family transcriptional regulator n=1 Tax=Nonomuraea sp. NPDC050328 TaxID=3364361 RepID=UPI0037BC3E19